MSNALENQLKLASTINAKSFGATGNGSTDDTAALQAALTAATGGTLYLPKGNYRVSSGLTVPNRTRIVGDGPTNTLINYRTALTTANQLFDFDNVDNIHLEDIGLNCETGAGGRTTTAVLAQGDGGSVTEMLLRRVYITGFQQYGVRINTATYYTHLDGCRILSCSNSVANGGDGLTNAIAVSIGSPVNALRITNCRISSNDTAIDCNTTAKYSLVIQGCYFEQNGRASAPAAYDTITLYGWAAVQFVGNYVEANLTGTTTADSFLKLKACSGVQITGNLFAGSYAGVAKSKNLIGISTSCVGVVIDNNELQDPATLLVYVADGTSIASLRRNRYTFGGVVLTTYATIVARMTAALVELDVAHIAAVNTGVIGAAGNYQTNLTVAGVDTSRTLTVIATPQGNTAADWVFSAAPIATDTVRVMFYNIKGSNNTFNANVALRFLREG